MNIRGAPWFVRGTKRGCAGLDPSWRLLPCWWPVCNQRSWNCVEDDDSNSEARAGRRGRILQTGPGLTKDTATAPRLPTQRPILSGSGRLRGRAISRPAMSAAVNTKAPSLLMFWRSMAFFRFSFSGRRFGQAEMPTDTGFKLVLGNVRTFGRHLVTDHHGRGQGQFEFEILIGLVRGPGLGGYFQFDLVRCAQPGQHFQKMCSGVAVGLVQEQMDLEHASLLFL